MSDQDKYKIIEKIKKLMQMVEGGTPQEAENAAKLSQKILIKYNLNMAEVDDSATEDERVVGDELFEMGKIWKKVEGSWIVRLYSVISQNNFCRIITRSVGYSRSGKDIWVIGKMVNVELVNFMCKQLIPRIREMEARAWKEYQGWDKRGVYKRGFLLGCASGIGIQLYDQMDREKKVEPKLGALIILNDKLVDQHVSEKWPNLGHGRGSRTSSHDGYGAGKKAGKSMSIRKGISGNRSPSRLAGGGLLNG